ncbi:ClpX C4-type zinc finger protein [Nocardia macrotermitis]|uniref:ATP-dependent Clp protease ATP-binding subunit ClpX n=1 Tax=Nocardia macrotermitis TaxID=2585198 RepID=A0A7K0D6L4_9NOCA|nr:ClpX C4-type zinc finger protein [Nocardia macrotermitis]MQY21357.1 ATP-dependent Clp protease ATP-binding subunit ClpX [Nocardia macrotermitis]
MTAPTPAPPRCSFCGKPHTEVARLVAGPGVHICDECIGLAATITEQHRDSDTPRPLQIWESMSDDEMLQFIPRVAAAADQVEQNLRDWVQELRHRKVTWARIGGALGITRQSAWGRFSGEE